jgi:hypothetical protein
MIKLTIGLVTGFILAFVVCYLPDDKTCKRFDSRECAGVKESGSYYSDFDRKGLTSVVKSENIRAKQKRS